MQARPSRTQDKPWSQYFCCMVAAGRDFVRDYPVATKRAVRAVLKAANVCATEPERATDITQEFEEWMRNLGALAPTQAKAVA